MKRATCPREAKGGAPMSTHSGRRRNHWSDITRLEMTPMIDVVFQLLIFFVIAVKPEDLLSHLDITRGESPAAALPLIRVEVLADGLTVNGKRADIQFLDGVLSRLPAAARDRTVLVACESQSRHEGLVQVLDTCAKSGYARIAMTSR
jgi:biopolymer transport protein ExbD